MRLTRLCAVLLLLLLLCGCGDIDRGVTIDSLFIDPPATPPPESVQYIFSGDGGAYCVSNPQNRLYQLDGEAREELSSLPEDAYLLVLLDRGGRLYYVASNCAYYWDSATGETRRVYSTVESGGTGRELQYEFVTDNYALLSAHEYYGAGGIHDYRLSYRWVNTATGEVRPCDGWEAERIYFLADGDTAFYMSELALWSEDLATGETRWLTKRCGGDPISAVVQGDTLYYITRSVHDLYRVPLSGGESEKLAVELLAREDAHRLLAEDGRVLVLVGRAYVENGDYSVYELDGVTGAATPTELGSWRFFGVSDGTWHYQLLYWSISATPLSEYGEGGSTPVG